MIDNTTATSPPPLFGHVTPWSLQLAYVFALYACVTLVCSLVFFVGRWRKMRRLHLESDNESQALIGLDGVSPHGVTAEAALGPVNPVLFVWRLMRMSATRLELVCGADGAHYLRFTRMALLALAISTVFGLACLLPIYVSGTGILNGCATTDPLLPSCDNITLQFDLTTASNLAVGDSKLWATVFSVFLNSTLCWVLALWMLRVQSQGPRAKVLSVKDFTVHIRHFPTDVMDEGLLAEFFWEALELRPEECVVSPNLEALHAMHRETKQTLAALERAKTYNAANAPQRATKLTLACARVDAEHFYQARKEELQRKLAQQQRASSGTGHAFVTLSRLDHVERALSFFASLGGRMPQRLLEGRWAPLMAQQWQVVAAPNPRDIIHKNLAAGPVNRVARMAAINVVLAVGMIFFTTPISLIAVLSEITQANILSVISSKLAQVFSFFGDANTVYGFVSSTLMVIFTFAIPRVLMLAARTEKHHTRSHTEMSVVRKIYAYLFLCIILMPAIFMTSVDALLKIALSENGGWQILRDLGGVFPRAIFFVNYLLAIGLVSNFLELLNFPGVAVAWYRRRNALTAYERRRGEKRDWKMTSVFATNVLRAARKAAKSKFLLGYEYAYQMVLLSMTLLFSSVVPLLMPFAFFAFLTKHFVDRNNLVYVYSRPQTNTKIVRIVLTQVLIGCAFYQMAMFCFFLFSKEDQVKAIVVGMLLTASVVVGMYVRFWTLSGRRATRYDFDEEGAAVSRDMLRESYRDKILAHDVVHDFYTASSALSRSSLVEVREQEEAGESRHQDQDDEDDVLN